MDRTGRAWSYVALGDSVAAGFGATASYPEVFAGHIEEDVGVAVRLWNRAIPGARTAEILRIVRTDGALGEAIAAADVVTISAGGQRLPARRSRPPMWSRSVRVGNDFRRAAGPVAVDPPPSARMPSLLHALGDFQTTWDAMLSEWWSSAIRPRPSSG